MNPRTFNLRRWRFALPGFFATSVLALAAALLVPARLAADPLVWSCLPPMPIVHGFAVPFAGISGGALIVAGGANFPEKPPWQGGKKVWHATAYVLEKNATGWRASDGLASPRAYGASVTTSRGVVCIGGSDAERHFDEVFLLTWANGCLKTSPLPALPVPCADLAAVLLESTLYIAGGRASPESTVALANFWSLDLDNPSGGWRELEPWPGSGRMLATLGAQENAIYLFGGVALRADTNGQPAREYLRDAYLLSV